MQKQTQTLPTALAAYRLANAALLRRMRRAAATLDADIADLTRTYLRMAERDGWTNPQVVALDVQITRYTERRDELLALAGMTGGA